MIMDEMQAMQVHDNSKHPLKGMREIKKTGYFQEIAPDYMDLARQLVEEEAESESSAYKGYPYFKFCEAMKDVEDKAQFFPGSKEYDLKEKHSIAEQIEALRFEFDTTKRHMEKELGRCEKLEKALKVIFGGYYKKEESLITQFSQCNKNHLKKTVEEEVFKVFEGQEHRSIVGRLDEAKKGLEMQEHKENELQIRYANLRNEKERLEKTLAALRGKTQ